MPTVGIKKYLLDRHLQKVYTEKEFEELCFEYGIELDDVTTEKAAVEKERSLSAADSAALSDVEIYKIDITANRYDLLCVEGLSRAIRVFKKELSPPNYKIVEPLGGRPQQIIVKKETATVRPFVVGAILRNITFDADSYADGSYSFSCPSIQHPSPMLQMRQFEGKAGHYQSPGGCWKVEAGYHARKK